MSRGDWTHAAESRTAEPSPSAIGERPRRRPELSVVMPCLNEAAHDRDLHPQGAGLLREPRHRGRGRRRRQRLDRRLAGDRGGARRPRRAGRRTGLRRALTGGIAAARGRWVIMGDADDSYDFADLEPFVRRLREGYDLVDGNRFKGGIREGAMPWLHRWLGNPVLSFVGRRLYGTPLRRHLLRAPRLRPREGRCTRHPLVRDGVRDRDDRQGDDGRAARHGGADDALAGRRGPGAAPEHLARWLALDPAAAPLQPEVAVPLPGPVPPRSSGSREWPGCCPGSVRSASVSST